MPMLPRPKYIMKIILLFGCLMLVFLTSAAAQTRHAPVREMDFDEEGEEEPLNRALWQSIKKTPYQTALRHIARVKKQAAKPGGARATLPNGWQISPAGTQTDVGRLPMETIVFNSSIVVLNAGYYRPEQPEVSVVDKKSRRVVKVLHLPGLYPAAAVSAGTDLYISGGNAKAVFRYNTRFERVREYAVNGFAAGIAVVDADRIAVVLLVTSDSTADYQNGEYKQGKLVIINTKTGAVEREARAGYFPQSVRFMNGKYYVTEGGENNLLVFDSKLDLRATIPAGSRPRTMCEAPGKLFVVAPNSDEISVVDTAADTVTSTIKVNWTAGRFGSAPTACAAENNRLYVSQANTNGIAVVNVQTGGLLGFIPTGFYPTSVTFADGDLLVTSAKGTRARRPNVDGPQSAADRGPNYVLNLLYGTLGFISKADIAGNLQNWTRQVNTGSPVFNARDGFKIPIKHIFYIVRENRTYDQILGDLPRGDGDSFLTLFGRAVTPNAHRLAEEFVTADNYFADGEISVLGHSFTTSGYAGPFLQWIGNAHYAGRFAAYPFGMVPAVTSPSYLWDTLDEKGIDYRIYGENYYLYTRGYRILAETFGANSEIAQKFYARTMQHAASVDRGNAFFQFAKPFYGRMDTKEAASALLENAEFAKSFSVFLCGDESLVGPWKENRTLRLRFAEYLVHYPSNYRSWDLNTSDLERAAAWKIDFEKQIAAGGVAALSYLWLPNDHTGGSDKRYLPPEQLVAQNDAALGFIISAISKSPVWKDSLVLVTEDDAQNGPDHVDATRTVFLAAGPYVKRGAVVNSRYDQLSLLRTIEIALGLSPMNSATALAAPMFDIFTPRPDLASFEPAADTSRLSDDDRKAYRKME
jgi:Phosphoesterase family